MPNDISPETESQITALTREISIANHLDPEIQRELRTHLEDKLHAYLTGQIPLSEADALLLAKSHFGNPATIQSLFHTLHPTARPLSLARKCASAIIATLAASLLLSFFQSAWTILVLYPASTSFPPEKYTPALLDPLQNPGDTNLHFLTVIGMVIGWLIQIGALWTLLYSFRRQHIQGKRPWFEKRNQFLLLAIVAAAFITYLFLSAWITSRTWNAAPAYSHGLLLAYTYPGAYILFPLSAVAAQAFLWLSYFAPKNWPDRLTNTLCWLLYHLATPIFQTLLLSITFLVSPTPYRRLTTLFASQLTFMLYDVSRLLLISALAVAVHYLLTQRRRQSEPTPT